MALLDVLQERTDRRHRTAQADCGALGLLSVEALPPAELARLQNDRAVLYAACRELQSAGEALRRAGKLFTPDEITAYLSDEEAASGAAAVRDISGVSASRRDSGTGTDMVSGDQDGSDSRTENGEIRLDAVQEKTAVLDQNGGSSPADFGGVTASAPVLSRTKNREIRLGAVQDSGTETTKVRHDPVQRPDYADRESPAPYFQNRDGQDSREFCPEPSHGGKTDKKSLGIVDLPGWDTRNLGETSAVPSGENPEDGTGKAARLPHEMTSELPEAMHETASESGRFGAGAMHETTSDFQEQMHETTSESTGFGTGLPHEIKSESREVLHEAESESNGTQAETLHETTSESGRLEAGAMHEIKSDFQRTIQENALEIPEGMHEMTSESGAPAQKRMHEIRSEVREVVHEMESELTDRVARSILEGLRRAAAVR